MSVVDFVNKFGGMTEEYSFYGGAVTLRYDPKDHLYLLVTPNGLVPQDGVTSICHIIDKSEALIPWATKMMALRLFAEAPVMELPTGDRVIRQMTFQEYENLVLAAKTAHKDKLEEAGEVGHIAHDWIERYIKAVIAKDAKRQEELLAKFPADERATNACLAALDWMRDHNVRWLGTERKIYSRRFGYAGTMDGLCIVDSCDNPKCRGCSGREPYKDRLTISDWKTSNYLYTEYLLQTAAYMQAYNEENAFVQLKDGLDFEEPFTAQVTDRWIIRLGKEDAEFDPWYADATTYEQDWDAFRTALHLSRTIEAIKERVRTRAEALREAERAERKRLREEAEAAERERKAQEKAAKKAAAEAALKVKCKGADKYKGTRAPKCNGGNPCETCVATYAAAQAAKVEKPKKAKKQKTALDTLAEKVCDEMIENLRANVPVQQERLLALDAIAKPRLALPAPKWEPFNSEGTMCPPDPELVNEIVNLSNITA